jgi:branched-subunit amino acid aminotransferase/4-amino-4-deoxychorismate lyase
MIWVAGKILDAEALNISVHDRTFEHGLGLFETLRTWDGAATLLDRHRNRLRRSARSLGLPLREEQLPDLDAVRGLLDSMNFQGDARLRLTLSGGVADVRGSTLWMTASALPSALPTHGVSVQGRFLVSKDDELAKHKTLNYWRRRLVAAEANDAGHFDMLSVTTDGRVWEGSRANLFLVRAGKLHTAGLNGPLLPGIMREFVITKSVRADIACDEESVGISLDTPFEEAFLTTSLRGVIPIHTLEGQRLLAPGPVTKRLQVMVDSALRSQESYS